MISHQRLRELSFQNNKSKTQARGLLWQTSNRAGFVVDLTIKMSVDSIIIMRLTTSATMILCNN